MFRAGIGIFFAAALGASTAYAAAPQDTKTVLSAASKAIGADGLTAIKMWGSGANYQVGQSNHAGGPWPRTNLNDYVRAIDFTQPASRATGVTVAVAVTGGPAATAPYNQTITPASNRWEQQLEIWTTPWGFLKGAEQNHATVATKAVAGKTYRVVTWMTPLKAPSGVPYKLVGYIGSNNLVDRVDTWVENPVLGDLKVETFYSDYRDAADGLKYPSTIVQKRDGQVTFDAQILGAAANPADLAQLLTQPPRAGGGGPPGGPRPTGPASERLADGVYRLKGAYNALAVEFSNYVVLFEPGPQNEERAQAIIDETKRLIPGKPISYGVISHHHFDHTGGLTAVVANGITIVAHKDNADFIRHALAQPRTLAPDAMSKSGKKPVIEAIGDKKVFTDGTRTFEIHRIKGLPHADGLVVGWLPKEKILVYADMFNLPPPNDPVPNPPVVGTRIFLNNLERLHIEPERILSIHSLNPDRLTSMQDIRGSLGVTK